MVAYEDKKYLLRVVNSGSISCGAWLDADGLKLPKVTADQEERGITLFLDREGNVLSGQKKQVPEIQKLDGKNTGKMIYSAGENYLQIVKDSRVLPISMAILLPERVYMGSIYAVQNVIGLLLAATLLSIPFLWKLLSKSVTRPVNELVDAMNQVEKGDMETRVFLNSRFLEFEKMGNYFNRMIEEIVRLQKDVYERQIREQKTELQYLQTQIRPHFFLNTLNIIHSFSLIGRNDLIEKMVKCLSAYFSYLFKKTDSFVTLGEEKRHIENYLELHRLRYQNRFSCYIEIEDVLLDAKLPPLVIQTFVENSLKYGMTDDREFELELTAEVVAREGQKLQITVSDNGRGYEKEVLEAAEQGDEILERHGHGIGINNVMQRLRLIYHGEAQIHLSNLPDFGACTRIILPLEFEEEEE